MLLETVQKHKHHDDYFPQGLQSLMPFINLISLDCENLETAFQFQNIYFCLARQILGVDGISCAC